MPVKMVCQRCGSDHVSRDAWADWDAAAQQWLLGTVFDYGHCHVCECETTIVEHELTPTV